MIEELYRTLIMNKIDPNPDTLRMYMRGEKTLGDLEKMDDDQYFENSKSNARKVIERLMSRGYDNIISDKHLKVKERFL